MQTYVEKGITEKRSMISYTKIITIIKIIIIIIIIIMQ